MRNEIINMFVNFFYCAVVCPRLESVDNVEITYSTSPNSNDNFGSGTVATHDCVVGFGLLGESSRTCQNNEQWSGAAPSCEREHIYGLMTNVFHNYIALIIFLLPIIIVCNTSNFKYSILLIMFIAIFL